MVAVRLGSSFCFFSFPFHHQAIPLSRNRLVAAGAVTEAASAALDRGVLGNGDDVDGDGVELYFFLLAFFVPSSLKTIANKTYAEVLKEILGLGVDVELAALGVLGEVESGDLGNVLILALTLLLLKLEGDTADGTTLDTLHQVGGVAGNLVAEALGSNDGNLIANTFIFSLSITGQRTGGGGESQENWEY